MDNAVTKVSKKAQPSWTFNLALLQSTADACAADAAISAKRTGSGISTQAGSRD
ncbi:hypothetical protein [Roseateles sp. BYS96W]|uniref:Uncharacterized protein n=1 Tax=Pelomonas nitida TaxID=3299027 RepID=A0ABW7G2Z0_9BURK